MRPWEGSVRHLRMALPQNSVKQTKSLQGVKAAAAMNAQATEAGAGVEAINFRALAEVAGGVGKEAGVAAGVKGAEGGVEQMVEEAAANEIVEGHQYFE